LFGLAEADPLDEGKTTAEIIRAITPDTNTGRCECEALRDAVFQLCDATAAKPPGVRSLGSKLGHLCGRIVGGRALVRKEKSNGLAQWHVEAIGQSPDSSDSSDSFTDDPYARAHAHMRACETAIKESEESEESADVF
jgi:hypothetical protein